MSDPLFDVVFRGDIVPGQSLPQVKQRLAALFKRDAAQIDALFTGQPLALKKAVDSAAADKYKKVLAQAGALVEIRPAGTLKTPVQRPRARPDSAPAPVASQADNPVPAQPAASGLSLAPLGGNLLSDAELAQNRPAPVLVQPLQAGLRPLDGSLVDDHEIDRPAAVTVAELALDLSDLGEPLVAEEEIERPAPVAVAALQVELAPVGSDMGQAPRAPAPPAPDTSGLSLAD